MGEAKNRGTHEERREQALERRLETSEVIFFFDANDGKLNFGTLTRDDPPNQDSPAVIFAAYIHANFERLAGEAIALHDSHEAAQRGQLPMGNVIVGAPKRSIVTPAGDIASEEAPALVGPDGRPLQ